MRLSRHLRCILTFATSATIAGAALAQTGDPPDPGGMIYGQQNSWQAPMGETGSPHGGALLRSGQATGASRSLQGGSTAPDAARMGAGRMDRGWLGAGGMRGSRMGAARNPDQAGELNFVGQQSTHHTPMGETGTPHGHE